MEEPTYQEIGSTRSGPPGANLFIYHLPKSFSDLDLYNLFVQCGKLVSVKIFKDKITEESKCFGFVSYEKENNAKIAIQKLNGFQVNKLPQSTYAYSNPRKKLRPIIIFLD